MKLTRSEIETLVQVTHDSFDKNDLYGRCPSCGHMEFGISLVEPNHPFSCFRQSKCGFKGNIFTLLKFLGKTREYLGDKKLQDTLSSFEDVEEEELNLTLPQVKIPVGWQRSMGDEYLIARGFTSEQFEKFKIGRSRFKKDYVTILIEMYGTTTGYVSRSVKSKQWIDEYNEKMKKTGGKKHLRYDNSPSDFSKMLFGYDEIVHGQTTDVILVEGPLSKTKTDANLDLDSDTWIKCCATFGAKVSKYQIKLLKLKGVTRIWLWFEADVIDKVKRIAEDLSVHFEVKVAYLQGKDPGDMNSEEAIGVFDICTSPLNMRVNYI